MKTIKSASVRIILAAVLLSSLAGCNELLTVDFQKNHALRYKFVSSRNIEITWEQAKSQAKPNKSKVNKLSESMEMLVSYRPLEVDHYGLSTIEATCESVKVKRTSTSGGRGVGSDAVRSLIGKSFTFTVNPAGKIEDYSQMDELIRQTGSKVFRANATRGRIKEPDMIGDFIATQWFLWDSVSSIGTKKAVEGIRTGQSWKSRLSVPAPMVLRKARDVTYTLDEIRRTDKGKMAVIKSSYSLAESVPKTWPIPYSGRFRASGTFGFLRNYTVLDLQGCGEELFNIDTGRTEHSNQQYQMKLIASLPMGLGSGPMITIKQNLTMVLLED